MFLHEYIKPRGAAASLARLIDVDPPLISQWANGVRMTPADRCPAIERATLGKVTCEELRGDLAWKRVKRQGWKWHPDGKPLLDVTGAA